MAVELGYFAIPSPDPAKGAVFWSELFGWTFAAPDEAGFYDIENTKLPGGLGPIPGDHVLTWFRVDDIQASIARVRELGGIAPEPAAFPYGLTAGCQDDQGVPFSLWQMAPGFFPDGRRGDGRTSGEPAYFVVPSPDSARGETFYAALFGWEFAPEGGNGYRHATNIALPGGIGGLEAAEVTAWFRVPDIAASIAALRGLGGDAEKPSASESGLSAACRDNQGIRFHLWQPAPNL